MNLRSGLAAGLALAAGMDAHGARPLVTEDASILDPKACQVEAWVQKEHASGSRRSWLVPACNPWSEGGAELAVGAARNREAGEGYQSELVLQGKTLFRPTETNDWGIGLVAGTIEHRQLDGRREWYATVPVSVSRFDDRLMMHANVGWLREQDTGRHFATWGLAVEGQVHARLTLLAEAFGLHEGRPLYQVGMRFEAAPRVLLDATIGNRFGSGERFFSIGVHLETPPGFLP
jgi:hypothetical protein